VIFPFYKTLNLLDFYFPTVSPNFKIKSFGLTKFSLSILLRLFELSLKA